MKKIILATLLSVFGISGVFAQSWTKEMQKDFRKQKEVAFAVDLSDAKIMGVSREKFPTYYAGRFKAEKEYADLVIEKFEGEMESEFFKQYKKIKNNDAPYKVVYVITDITENGGLSGYFYVDKGGNISAKQAFSVKDGKWNDFEILLKERVGKLMKTGYYGAGESPFDANLYKY